MWKSICKWQLIGQRGLSVSASASQILACCHHLYCGSALRLWIFHGKHLTPCPERYFKVFFSDRNPGVRECHGGVKSVCGPQAKDRIYDAPVDDIRWIFSFLSGEPLCPPRLINHWAVLSLLSLLKRSVLSAAFCWVEKWFQSAQSASCVLTNCDRFSRLISVELEWLSKGRVGGSAWISSVINAAF